MTARSQVAALLADGLPEGWRIIGHSRQPDRVDQRTAIVWQTELEPHAPAGRDAVLVTLTVQILTPHVIDVARADDDLEDALAEVLAVLHPVSWVLWTRAARIVAGDEDQFHGYEITLTAGGELLTEGTP